MAALQRVFGSEERRSSPAMHYECPESDPGSDHLSLARAAAALQGWQQALLVSWEEGSMIEQDQQTATPRPVERSGGPALLEDTESTLALFDTLLNPPNLHPQHWQYEPLLPEMEAGQVQRFVESPDSLVPANV